MPMFGFSCTECGASFEEWVRSASAIDEVRCPQCGGKRVHKQLSRVARMKTGGSTVSSAACSTGST